MVRETFKLWGECAQEAGHAVLRSPLAMLALLGIAPVLALVNLNLAPHLGFVGGFLMGFLQALAAGWYLALVEIAVNARRRVTLSDLYEQLGSYASEVLSVMFVFFVLSLLFGVVGATPLGLALLVVVPALAIAFNPAPEMVTQERVTGTDLLSEAFRFVRANAPEWLLPQVGATLVAGLIDVALEGGSFGLDHAMTVLMTFGPFFGFISAGAFAERLTGASPGAVLAGLVSLVFVHAFMLFRAILYKRLRSSSRRGRAWSSRA